MKVASSAMWGGLVACVGLAIFAVALWASRDVETGGGGAGSSRIADAPKSRRRPIVEVNGTKVSAKGPVAFRIVGELPNRPVTPGDLAAFNAAVDAGATVEDASRKAFPSGTDTDGIIAALKLMALSKDAKMRRGAYRAVARLFTDVDDLGAALATAKALLAAMPTSSDDGDEGQEVDLGDGEDASEDDGGEVASAASEAESASEPDVCDDSEAEPEAQDSGESEIAASAEVEPMCDGVQGEAIERLLKDGVADADAEVRREALAAASQMEDHFRYGAYEEALKGGDSALKKEVLELCSQFGREEDVAVQRQALKDADPTVAAAAQKNLDSDVAKAFIEADAAAKAAEPQTSVK